MPRSCNTVIYVAARIVACHPIVSQRISRATRVWQQILVGPLRSLRQINHSTLSRLLAIPRYSTVLAGRYRIRFLHRKSSLSLGAVGGEISVRPSKSLTVVPSLKRE